MGGLSKGDKELWPIGVFTGVSHTEEVLLSVTELEVLISELLSVDRLATSPITFGEVTTLCHEAGDHAVENTVLEVERSLPSKLRHTSLTSTELSEVLSGPRHDVGEELEHNSASFFTTDLDIEVNSRVFERGCV